MRSPRLVAAVLAVAVVSLACAARDINNPTRRLPAQDPSIPLADQNVAAQNENLRRSLRELSDENRKLEQRLRRLERNVDADKRVLIERNAALERLLAERERVVDAKASEAYARGRLEMAGEIVEKLEVRGVPSRRERWLGADHYYAFEVWYDTRRVVHVPVQTKDAEDPRKMLLSSAVSAASLISGL